MQPISTPRENVYAGKCTGAVILFIGVIALCCGAAIPFVSADPWMAAALVGLPACSMGFVAILSGMASISTSIQIGTAFLVLASPQWRGCPWPPVKRRMIEWGSIKGLSHRKEVYHLLPGEGLPMLVDAYAIETENSMMVFAGKTVPHLARAINDIAIRSGQPIREEAHVRASIIKSLVSGAPHWKLSPSDDPGEECHEG